jgi:hypothetical protein
VERHPHPVALKQRAKTSQDTHERIFLDRAI